MDALGPPLDTRTPHRLLRALLLDVLVDLGPAGDGWHRPTPCPGWSVKDVAAHLVGNALTRLSAQRDGYTAGFVPPQATWGAFVAALAEHNEAWVAAWRRVSPPLVLERLERSGEAVLDHLEALPPGEPGAVVSWAGEGPHPNWLDAAREYSEDWAHVHDVLAALDAPPLERPDLLAPLLDTLVRALPHAYRERAAAGGTAVALETTGAAAGRWLLRRGEGAWALVPEAGVRPATTVVLDAGDAWRLLLRRAPAGGIRARARVEGDPALAAPLWDAAALIA